MPDIHAAIGADLQGFGGHLECRTCRTVRPLGDVGGRLRDGWPKCCGYTMRWVTQRQLDERAVPGAEETPSCSTCDGDGIVACRAHAETSMNEACFACWNGEPCPECHPLMAWPVPGAVEDQ